jgi:hypothetical protein
MQVYAVIGGFNYEGEHFDSLRLFDCRTAADLYRQELELDRGYDYALMEVREVCLESRIGELAVSDA